MGILKKLFLHLAAAGSRATEAVQKIELPTDPVQDTKPAADKITQQAEYDAVINNVSEGRCACGRELVTTEEEAMGVCKYCLEDDPANPCNH